MAKFNSILFFVDIIVGIYFLNLGLNFVNLQFFDPIKNWIAVAGGALLILSGLMSLMSGNRRPQQYR